MLQNAIPIIWQIRLWVKCMCDINPCQNRYSSVLKLLIYFIFFWTSHTGSHNFNDETKTWRDMVEVHRKPIVNEWWFKRGKQEEQTKETIIRRGYYITILSYYHNFLQSSLVAFTASLPAPWLPTWCHGTEEVLRRRLNLFQSVKCALGPNKWNENLTVVRLSVTSSLVMSSVLPLLILIAY